MIRLVLIAAVLTIAGCGKDSYLGFYYPDASNLYNDVSSPRSFETLDQCRGWIREQKRIHNPNGNRSDDYECGLNCDTSSGKPYVCDATVR
jgi:predicted small lipoprotein YifL